MSILVLLGQQGLQACYHRYEVRATLERLEAHLLFTQLDAMARQRSLCLRPQGAWHLGYQRIDCQTRKVLQRFPEPRGHLSYNRQQVAIAANGQTADNGTFHYRVGRFTGTLTVNRLASTCIKVP